MSFTPRLSNKRQVIHFILDVDVEKEMISGATIRMGWQWIDIKKRKMCVEDFKSKFIPNIKEGTIMIKGDNP